MVTVLSYPSLSVGPSSMSWKLKTLTTNMVSPLTGKTQTQDNGAAKWMCELDYALLSQADLSIMSSFLAQMNGEQGRVFISPLQAPTPRGSGLFAPSSTNFIRNNSMVGAVAGTPGTPPTNWSIASTNGITETVVGTGTEFSLPFIDIHYTGTPTATSTQNITFDTTTGIPIVNAIFASHSLYARLTGGALTNVSSFTLRLGQYNSTPTFLSDLTPTNILATLSGTFQRFSQLVSTNNVSVASVQPYLQFGYTNGQAINFTIRIYGNQLEKLSAVSPVILTTGTATFRSPGPFIKGSSQSGLSLTTGGWMDSKSGLLIPGDFFNFSSPKGNSLKITVSSVSSDIFGNATVSFAPRIRSIPSDQVQLVLSSPACVMKLVDDTSNSMQIQPAISGSIHLSFVEAIPT